MDRDSADVAALLAADVNSLETTNLTLTGENLVLRELLSEALDIAHQAIAYIARMRRE